VEARVVHAFESAPPDARPLALRNFTAALLLKMRHITHVIFHYHKISEFVNLPQMYLSYDARLTIKVYYELLDNLLLVPKTCVNTLVLQNCALHELNKVRRMIAHKYSFHRSTSGWEFVDYLQQLLRGLFARATDQTWATWAAFKHYYYVNLFAALFNLKQRYHVQSHEALEALENAVGRLVEEHRARHVATTEDFALLDRLDKGLYELFLDIKADFNSPGVESDPAVVSNIKKNVHEFLYDFLKSAAAQVDENFLKLANDVDQLVLNWRGVQLSTNTPLSPAALKSDLAAAVFRPPADDASALKLVLDAPAQSEEAQKSATAPEMPAAEPEKPAPEPSADAQPVEGAEEKPAEKTPDEPVEEKSAEEGAGQLKHKNI